MRLIFKKRTFYLKLLIINVSCCVIASVGQSLVVIGLPQVQEVKHYWLGFAKKRTKNNNLHRWKYIEWEQKALCFEIGLYNYIVFSVIFVLKLCVPLAMLAAQVLVNFHNLEFPLFE